MDRVRSWWNTNVDKKQLTTLMVATAAIGLVAYGANKAGFGQVAKIAKGG